MRRLRAVGLLIGAVLAAVAGSSGAASSDDRTPQARTLTSAEMLIAGAHANRLDVVLYLLDKGVSVDATGKNGYTALMVAAGRGAADVVDLLLARGADVDRATSDGWTALMEAAYRDQDRMVVRLLKAGARADAREARLGLTPLLVAAKGDRPASVTALLEAGADVDAVDRKNGLGALHHALASRKQRSDQIAAELLVRGADAGLPAKDGFTPLMSAARSGSLAKATLVLSENVDVNARSRDGRTALGLAAANGHVRLVRRLLQAGARARAAPGEVGALTEAIQAGSHDVVRLLLENDADPNRPGRKGRTPLALAAIDGDERLTRLLLDKGAAVDGRDAGTGSTALMWAANTGRKRIVELLMERGADPTLAAKDGWTAASAARMAGHDDIARLLEEEI